MSPIRLSITSITDLNLRDTSDLVGNVLSYSSTTIEFPLVLPTYANQENLSQLARQFDIIHASNFVLGKSPTAANEIAAHTPSHT